MLMVEAAGCFSENLTKTFLVQTVSLSKALKVVQADLNDLYT